MADLIRMRMAAARAGVSLALAALVGGLTPPGAAARNARAGGTAVTGVNFLKLDGLRGNVRQSFLKLELKFLKIESAVGSLEHKLARGYETTHKINTTFLKIKSADTEFLKIDSANADFLKITDASTNFLKIDAANTEFLKITDANGRFLPVGGTAVNAGELAGAQPQSFERSSTGTALIPAVAGPTSQVLLATAGGEIVVKAGYGAVPGAGTAGPNITITNGTSALLPAVQDHNSQGTSTSADVAVGQTRPFALAGTDQLHIQFFNVPGLFGVGAAATLVVSVEPDTSGNIRFVAQLIAGSL